MRKVLTIAAALIAVVAGALVFVVLPDDRDALDGVDGLNSITATKTYSGATHLLEVGGTPMRVNIIAAGGPSGQVVDLSTSTGAPSKHIGAVLQDDIVVEVNLSEISRLGTWLAETWANTPARRSGTLTSYDYNGVPTSQTQFSDALLTSALMPSVDSLGAANTPANVRLTIAPAAASVTNGQGSLKTFAKPPLAVSNTFRFALTDLPTARVAKVDAFDVKSSITVDETGIFREPTKTPTALSIPNLRVLVPSADAQPWKDWVHDFLVNGNNSDAAERRGSLEFLSPDLKGTVTRVDVGGCGPVRHSTVTSKSSTGTEVTHLAIELYCETMTPTYPNPAP